MLHARQFHSLPVAETATTSESQYTAIVHAADGVRLVAVARRPDEIAARVVDYIRERCDQTLWPADARRVHALIDDRELYAAIALYFLSIGGRWDEEKLELGGLSFARD
jgi:hypothetical protein